MLYKATNMVAKSRKTRYEVLDEKSGHVDEWLPASSLDDIEGLEHDKYVYRWAVKQAQRVKKLQKEGWSFVNEADGDHIFHRRVPNLDDGRQMTSEIEFREVVLMKLPIEKAEARRRYYQRKTDRAMELINREVAQQAAQLPGTEVTPTARIESGKDLTVIE